MANKPLLLIEKLPFNRLTRTLFGKDKFSYKTIIDSNTHFVFCGVNMSDNESLNSIFFFFMIPTNLIDRKKKEGEEGFGWTIRNSIKTFQKDFASHIGAIHGKRLNLKLSENLFSIKGKRMTSVLLSVNGAKRNVDIEKIRDISEKVRNLIIANLSSKDPLRHKKINP